MPTDRLVRNPVLSSTKLGKAIEQNRTPLEKISIRNLLDLRKALATGRLDPTAIAAEEQKSFKAFSALSRVFPPAVAMALVERGINDLNELSRWREQQFKEALSNVRDETEQAIQQQRFSRFLKLVASTRRPETVSGLQVDLGDDFAALDRQAPELAGAGVESIVDWARLRNEVKVDAQARQLLDGYSRLSVLGLDPKTIKHLLTNKIDSAAILARQSNDVLKQIARSGGVDEKALTNAQQLALKLLDELVLNLDDRLPGWDGPIPGLWPRPCNNCATEESVFSKFAYYLYLVSKTEKSFHDLEITLFQDFSRITPADDQPVTQVSICNQVLRLALGRELTADEQLPATRYRVIAALRKAVARSPAQIVAFLDDATTTPIPADLLPRLTEAYNSPPPMTDEQMLNQLPVFTRSEIETLGQVGEAILVQEIQSEPGFAGATAQQLRSEVSRRISERAATEIEFVQLIRRAAYKKALNKTDRQLFRQLFIETDLPLCEQSSKLDQAIRTLQAYLERFSTSEPPYLSYAAWRGEVLANKYPESSVLVRDDVLSGSKDTFDRGSFLMNHVAQYAELKSQLKTVRDAVDAARIDTDNNLSISSNTWNNLNKFKDEATYEYFQRGLNVIDDVLEANNNVYRAAADLDSEEPGVALGRLQSAVSLLDRVDGELFDNDWFWANQQSSPKRYSELLKEVPAERKWRLRSQFFNFAQAPKKIFRLQQSGQTVAGLTDLTELEVGHSSWTAASEFEQQDAYIVRTEASGLNKFSAFRYGQGQNLADYTFSSEFRVKSYWRAGQPDRSPKVGLGFRLQDEGGYRLAVLGSHRFTGGDDGGSSVLMDILALQKKLVSGDWTTLAEHEIGTSNRVDIEGSSIKKDHWYGLTVSASGGRLTGSLRITPERTITLGPVQDASFAKGTISLFVQGTAEVKFRNVAFRAETPTGVPPFFAKRRFDKPIDLRSDLDDNTYWNHREMGESMSLELLDQPLAVPIDSYGKQKLNGVKSVDRDVYLTFPPGSSMVYLNRLDRLLERCLMMTYYLRFVAIPVRMAQANSAFGEFETAAGLLRLLYDEEPDDIEARSIYSFFDVPWWSEVEDGGVDAAVTRLRLGEVYLRWAEMLFRQNTELSRYQARRLYERVLRLYRREECDCLEQQRSSAQHVLNLARQANAPGQTAVAREVLRRDSVIRKEPVRKSKNWKEVQNVLSSERQEYLKKLNTDATPARMQERAVERIKNAEVTAIDLRARRAGSLSRTHAGQPLSSNPRVVSLSSLSLCTPDNPLENAQYREACLRLNMLKSCVNILGFSDTVVPPLRFEALLRIAQNFTALAQASERDVLQFRQAFEQETFALAQAQANLEQANLEVAIERLNVELAEGEIDLALLQQDQMAAGTAHFEALVSEGMSDTERQALASADAAAQLAFANAFFSFAAMPAQMIASAGAGAPSFGGPGQFIGALGGAMSSQATALSFRASLERQQQDREFQLQQMRFGLAIAMQGVALATQRWQIAELQQQLAETRSDFARDALAFLGNKMLSAASWLLLMKTAREQYRRRLSYAIEVSYLAERALAFELQNPALSIIRFDYYDPHKDGLLGATQLLTDLAQLEHRKLAFRQRKLQLTKTISLATQFPAAFEQFRNGPGIFAFSSLREMFERDFPSHYMCLIQSIRVTVVALVPPNQGIRATLRNTGVSQVVVGPPFSGSFETRTIRRNPESVALSAAFQASGVFILDYKDDLLLPFEGSGVATDWLFEMPKAANQFNYDTIADVLLTFEYTALEGGNNYRSEVINRLGDRVQAERSYSFRTEFADQWYDLHNPELAEPARAMVVSFDTRRADFGPNLDQLKIEHVSLYFSHDEAAAFTAVPTTYLNFRGDGNRDTVNSDAGGVISTRRNTGQGSAPASWRTAMIGQPPMGTWELSFKSDDAARDASIRQRFKQGEIKDILLVITYSGRLAGWT